MNIEDFVYKTVSGIENGLSKAIGKTNKNEEITKSDINFVIFIEPKNNKIIVHDSKTIKESKLSLNKVEFVIHFSKKPPGMGEYLKNLRDKTN